MKHAKRAVWIAIVFTAAAFFLAGCGGSNTADAEVFVTGIALDKTDEQVLQVGEYFEVTATITPSGATDQRIAWRSLQSRVALVLGNGLTVTVLGITPGETLIMAVTEDGGLLASCPVKVE